MRNFPYANAVGRPVKLACFIYIKIFTDLFYIKELG